MTVTNIGSIGAAASYHPESPSASGSNSGFSSILSRYMDSPSGGLDAIFDAASQKYNVPADLLKAVAKAESNFNANATSACGAMGIMQLMPATANSLGVSDAYDPEQNIMGGAKCLRQMLNQFGGNTELALAAYNAGPGNVQKYSGVPPFEETQNYVAKVLGYYGGGDLSVSGPTTFAAAPAVSESVMPASEQDIGMDSLIREMLLSMYQMQVLEQIGKSREQTV